MPNWAYLLVGALGFVVLRFCWRLIYELRCPCESQFAAYGEVRLREPYETATSYSECRRCGRKYVKATDWARAAILADRQPTGGSDAS